MARFLWPRIQGLKTLVAKPLLALGERILSFPALRRLGEGAPKRRQTRRTAYGRSPETILGAQHSAARPFSQAWR
jgi:hypothetical protein